MAKGKVVRPMGAKSGAPSKKPYGGTNKNMSGKKC